MIAGVEGIVLISLRCIDLQTKNSATPLIPCGSELARDCGVTGKIDIDWHGLIASKLAPTGECVVGENVFRQITQGLAGMPYLRRRIAMALWDVCNRAASNRLEG